MAGGGIAGCAAALAAARNGASVLLIEKQTMLGGLATAGLITYYLPLCDGEGRQMSYGIAEEFLRLSVRHYPEADIPESWRKNAGSSMAANAGGGLDPDYAEARRAVRYETRFSPGYMALLLEETLREAGVRIHYDTRICGVITAKAQVDLPGGIQTAAELEAYTRKLGAAGTVIRQILIENDSGRGAVGGKAFIDATGGAALFRYAGAPVRDHGQGNILASWYYYLKDGRQILREMGAAPSIMKDLAQEGDAEGSSYGAAGDLRWYSGTDGQSVSDFIADTHRKILDDLRAQDREVTILPTMPQLRMTRCMKGAYELKETENDVSFADSIGMCGDWRKRGMRYEIPYRCLYNGKFANLWAAGRCISVDDGMWDVSRVIPPSAVTGEAAGTAAALVVSAERREGDSAAGKSDSLTAATLPYEELAAALRAQGQRLTFEETK